MKQTQLPDLKKEINLIKQHGFCIAGAIIGKQNIEKNIGACLVSISIPSDMSREIIPILYKKPNFRGYIDGISAFLSKVS
jgi:hypothetical protein